MFGCQKRMSVGQIAEKLDAAHRNTADFYNEVNLLTSWAPKMLLASDALPDHYTFRKRPAGHVADMDGWPLLRASVTWHGELERLNAFIRAVGAQVVARDGIPKQPERPNRWEPLFDGELVAPNGCRLLCLTTPEELREEGAKMDHCVGGYSNVCMFYGSHIVSIRDADGSRLSTVEYRFECDTTADAPRLHIRQNYGPHDTTPPAAAQFAAGWLRTTLSSGPMQVDYDRIEAARVERAKTLPTDRNSVEARLGFKPRLPEDLVPILTVTRNALPRDCHKPFDVAIAALEGRMSVADFLEWNWGTPQAPEPLPAPTDEGEGGVRLGDAA
jgi:hypothetical protein